MRTPPFAGRLLPRPIPGLLLAAPRLALAALLPLLPLRAQEAPRARIMEALDPNRDPAWDWTVERGYTLFHSVNGQRPVEVRNVKLPFFCAGNPLNQPIKDMDPADGWMLVHRDFGTAEEAPPMPYFTLYNRYRSTFRVMLFNAQAMDDTYYVGDLSFWGATRAPSSPHAVALLTLFNNSRCFLQDYDGERKECQTCQMKKFGDWAVFDFACLGFDPGLAGKDPVLELLVTGVETRRLKLNGEGNLDLLEQVVKDSPPGFEQNGMERTAEALKQGYRWAGDVRKWVQEEATNPRNSKEPWFPAARALANLSLLGYAPWAAGLAGVIDAFVGGKDHASPREPLRFKGQFSFEIEGGLDRSRRLWVLGLHLKPGPQSLAAQRPVQDIPWGLVGFTRPPALTFELTEDRRSVHVRLLDDGGQVVNPACGMELVSTQVAFVQHDLATGETLASPFMDVAEAGTRGATCPGPRFVRELQWKYGFRIQGPVRFSDREIVVSKATVFRRP